MVQSTSFQIVSETLQIFHKSHLCVKTLTKNYFVLKLLPLTDPIFSKLNTDMLHMTYRPEFPAKIFTCLKSAIGNEYDQSYQ